MVKVLSQTESGIRKWKEMGNTRKKKRERNIQMKRSIEYGYRKNEKKKGNILEVGVL